MRRSNAKRNYTHARLLRDVINKSTKERIIIVSVCTNSLIRLRSSCPKSRLSSTIESYRPLTLASGTNQCSRFSLLSVSPSHFHWPVCFYRGKFKNFLLFPFSSNFDPVLHFVTLGALVPPRLGSGIKTSIDGQTGIQSPI